MTRPTKPSAKLKQFGVDLIYLYDQQIIKLFTGGTPDKTSYQCRPHQQ
jgi:hypothetical protein